MLAYAAWVCDTDIGQPLLDANAPLNYCAALDWWLDQGPNRAHANPEQRRALRASLVERALSSLVERALSETVGRRPAHQAGLLWRALRAAVSEETATILRSHLTVAQVLEQFESCLRRWRWDDLDLKNPVRWLIRSEREVQDILWVILRSLYKDLEDEDTLPKFGHSTYRADLGIPSLGLLIEVKFARSAAEFKAIEKQVLEDIVPYARGHRPVPAISGTISGGACVHLRRLVQCPGTRNNEAGIVLGYRRCRRPDRQPPIASACVCRTAGLGAAHDERK